MKYEIKFEGALPRKWVSGKNYNMLNCNFTQGNEDTKFNVHIKVEADSMDKAIKNVLEKVKDAVNIFEFCLGEEVKLDYGIYNIREEKSAKYFIVKTTSLKYRTAINSVFTKNQMEDLEIAQNIFNGKTNSSEKLILVKTIHWISEGWREVRNVIDRFLKFWIALEVIVQVDYSKVPSEVKRLLKELYPECSREKINGIVGKLYCTRSNIVHKGNREQKKALKKMDQLIDILYDITRDKLKLPSRELSKKYFLN